MDLVGLVRTLAESMQFHRTADLTMKNGLIHVLQASGAEKLVSCVGVDAYQLSIASPRIDGKKGDVAEQLPSFEEFFPSPEKFQSGTWQFKSLDRYSKKPCCLCLVVMYRHVSERGEKLKNLNPEYIGFIFKDQAQLEKSKVGFVDDSGEFQFNSTEYRDQLHTLVYCTYMMFLYRNGKDSIFPKHLSQKYWDSAVLKEDGVISYRPWGRDSTAGDSEVDTITVSVDLRQSTFAMELASGSKKRYADWMEHLILSIEKVAHQNNAIFDKFTGDGVICHFVVDEFHWRDIDLPGSLMSVIEDRDVEVGASLAAVKLSWEIVHVVEMVLDDLRKFLPLDNENFGACAGIARGEAIWSVDRAGQPIVVGRGVVHACRATNGVARTVRMTNGVFQRVIEILSETDLEFHQVSFTTKEYDEESGVKLRELREPPTGICADHTFLKAIIDKIGEDQKVRSG